MLFSLTEAAKEDIANNTRVFLQACEMTKTPDAMILSPQTLSEFLDASSVGDEVSSLRLAATDEESVARVNQQIRRIIITGRIPKSVGEALTEAIEVLGLETHDLTVHRIPLMAWISMDKGSQVPVQLNIRGKKQLADAVRELWTHALMSPFADISQSRPSIVVMRMPPAQATCFVKYFKQGWLLQSSFGFGRLAYNNDAFDEQLVDSAGKVVDRRINPQRTALVRNIRNGEMVSSTPVDGHVQSLSDVHAQAFVSLLKRAGTTEGLFAVRDDKRWLIAIPPTSKEVDSDVEVSQEESDFEPVVEEIVEIEVVELDEQPGDNYSEDSFDNGYDQSTSEPENVEEMVIEVESRPQAFDSNQEDGRSSNHKQSAYESAGRTLQACMDAIEETLRNWLFDDHEHEGYIAVVHAVANKRQLPYKQRLITLHEMREQGVFDEPSAEDLRFGFETMERFLREFAN